MMFSAPIALYVLAVLLAQLLYCYASPCQDIFIPVTLDRSFLSLLTGSNSSTENYVIGGTFCEPSTYVASRRNTLQILLHGAAGNRTYWSSFGLDIPSYNWVEYAGRLGYPALAIDRLCNGVSSHPSGFVCHIPSEAVVLHQLVQQARSGLLPITSSSRSFDKVILVCHSVGADICNYNAGSNPDDADSLILTGWSSKLMNGFTTTIYGGIAPASLVYPDRLGSLGPTYLTFASESGQRYLSYYGDFDPAIAHYDYLNQGTFTIGEASTALLSQRQSPNFTGSVFLLLGDQDPTYCQPNAVSALAKFAGKCSVGIAADTQTLFPMARVFQYRVMPNTGHNVILHRSAQVSFQDAFGFLGNDGF